MSAIPFSSSCTYTYAGWTHAGCYSEPLPPQKKNPFILAGYMPDVLPSIGRPQKKKESFKKASQVVISRVGSIET